MPRQKRYLMTCFAPSCCATPLSGRAGSLSNGIISGVASKYQNAVRRQRDVRRGGQSVPGRTVGSHSAVVSLYVRIEEVVVNVAVKNFMPVAAAGKADSIAFVRKGIV